jgi:hypothetical protein
MERGRERKEVTLKRTRMLTLRNSFDASSYSLVIVLGAGPAKARIVLKRTKLTKTPIAVYRATLRFSSAGG